MDDQSRKIALGVTAAAVGVVIMGVLYNRFRNRSENLEEDDESKKLEDESYVKAQELKKLGNKAFGIKDYDEAIRYYSEALALCNIDAHLLHSNRAAARMGANDFKGAIADADECIKSKPDWSKGYFRKGKALIGLNKHSEAFTEFARGLLFDPKSDELQKMLDQVKLELGPSSFDTRATLDKEMIKKYFSEISQKYCTELGISCDEIRKKIEQSPSEIDVLLEEEYEAFTSSPPLYLVITEILMNMETPDADAALKYSTKAFELNPEDCTTLIIHINAILRNKKSDFLKALEMTRNALKKFPNNVLLAHTLASIIIRTTELVGTTIPVFEILKELKLGLENPNANFLLMGDSGIRVWFKLFEDREIMESLQAEENRNMSQGTLPDQAYLNGLINGAFSKLVLEPFFVRALSLIVFNNPGLERILAPFRTAFFLLHPSQIRLLPSSGNQDVYDKMAPFIFALALQCVRNNYAWPVPPEDEDKIALLLKETRDMLEQNSEALVGDGKLDEKLSHHLILLSLYRPLHDLPNLQEVLEKVDRSSLHPFVNTLFQKSAFDPWEEEIIKEHLKTLTPIPEENDVKLYNRHVPLWDNAGLQSGRLTRTLVGEELTWLFPTKDFSEFNSHVNMLVASMGSGQEVYQMSTFHSNISLTGVDVSEERVAFAARQLKALRGNEAKEISCVVGDVNALEPSHFPKPFDVIIATNTLSHVEDPALALSKLKGLLRSGGLIKGAVLDSSYIRIIAKGREGIKSRFPHIVGDSDTSLPRVRKLPREEELRTMRNEILDTEDPSMEGLITTPAFYALAELATFLFNPKSTGFTFASIGHLAKEVGMEIVGFEFPGIAEHWVLRYKLENPEDPRLEDPALLDQFGQKYPEAFQSFDHSIRFVLRKP